TDRGTYLSFVLNPSASDGLGLLRNEVLNPLDIEIEKSHAEAFLVYFTSQCEVARQVRRLVDDGRQELVEQLIEGGRLAATSPQSFLGHKCRMRNGAVVSGERLLEMATTGAGPN